MILNTMNKNANIVAALHIILQNLSERIYNFIYFSKNSVSPNSFRFFISQAKNFRFRHSLIRPFIQSPPLILSLKAAI